MNYIALIRLAIPLALALSTWWFHRAYTREHDARTAEHAAWQLASDMAVQLQQAHDQAETARQQAKASEYDLRYQNALDAQRRASDRLIRVRSQAAVCASGVAAPVPADHSAEFPEQPAPGTAVAVTPEYVTACGANAAYGRSAYDWAADMVRQGLAVAGPGVE